MKTKLIVGLGNPGTRYTKTRHNIGHRLVQAIADQQKISFEFQKPFLAYTASYSVEDYRVILATLDLFMNVSGKGVRKLVRGFEVDQATDLLVAVDDVAIPFGRLRLRPAGSDGGHNGLKSVSESLGSQEYARLRFGIGLSGDDDSVGPPLEEYVLQKFAKAEEESMQNFLEGGLKACETWLAEPIERAMAAVNSYKI